jgi:hypothetical protein
MVKGPIGRGILDSALASKASFGALTELLPNVVLAAEATAAEAGRLAARKPAASTAMIMIFDRLLLGRRRVIMGSLLFLDPVRAETGT